MTTDVVNVINTESDAPYNALYDRVSTCVESITRHCARSNRIVHFDASPMLFAVVYGRTKNSLCSITTSIDRRRLKIYSKDSPNIDLPESVKKSHQISSLTTLDLERGTKLAPFSSKTRQDITFAALM